MNNELKKDTKKIRYKVDKTEINFIDMIIKAYEGIGIVNVDHDNPGQIWIDVTEGTEKEVKEVMEDLSEQFYVELLDS